MIVGPRIEFDPDHYPRIRVWDSNAGRDWYFYLHRLTAYAQGDLEHPCAEIEFPAYDAATGKVRLEPDPRHVHHDDADGWNNDPTNLAGVTPDEHAAQESHVSNLK